MAARGIKTFLDVDDMKHARFDVYLMDMLEQAPNFIVILNPGCLERCRNEKDWLRREIAHAIATHRKIVPVMNDGFDSPVNLYQRTYGIFRASTQ